MNRTTSLEIKPEMTLQERLAVCATQGVESIDGRLKQLHGEWTSERMVKATLGVAIIVGFVLSAIHDLYWLILPAIAGVMLLQYLFTQGGILALIYRKMGLRSRKEIDEEIYALRTLRGDFRDLPTITEVIDKESIARFVDEGGPAIENEDQYYGPKEAAAKIIEATR